MLIWEQLGTWWVFGFAPKMCVDCQSLETAVIMWVQLVYEKDTIN